MGRRIGLITSLVLMATKAMGFWERLPRETPLVVFDLPLTIECRDVTPNVLRRATRERSWRQWSRFHQLLAGEEKTSALHYEIPPSSRCGRELYPAQRQLIAGGTMAIKPAIITDSCWCILITPAASDCRLTADLKSSHAQYTLLAPKQFLQNHPLLVVYDLSPPLKIPCRSSGVCLPFRRAPMRASPQCNASATG